MSQKKSFTFVETGEVMTEPTFPKQQLEFHQAWSSCASRNSTLQAVANEILRRASEAFVDGNDRLADEYRKLARHFQAQQATASRELDGYIAESARRSKKKEQQEKENRK